MRTSGWRARGWHLRFEGSFWGPVISEALGYFFDKIQMTGNGWRADVSLADHPHSQRSTNYEHQRGDAVADGADGDFVEVASGHVGTCKR